VDGQGRPAAGNGPRPMVIVGPTAAGKSAVALAIATARPGTEIVSMDSMQVYLGMDIGTAKPTIAERDRVRHHCIDLVDPSQDFSVVQYREAALAAGAAVDRCGGLALYAGGTGLYARAVVDGLSPPPRFPGVAERLDREPDTHALHRRLVELDPVAAGRMEPGNRRRVIRALEVTVGSGRPFSSFGPGLGTYDESVPFRLVGVDCVTQVLDRRVHERYHRQMEEGFLDEVRALHARPRGMGRTAAQALGYKELLAHLRGELSVREALELAVRRTRRFVRRQRSWFGRDPRIEWWYHDGDPLAVVEPILAGAS